MRIAFFSLASVAHGGGYERQITQYARQLKKKGHEVTIVSLSRNATIKLAIFISFLYLRPRFSFPEISNDLDKSVDGIDIVTFSTIGQLKSIFKRFEIVYAKNDLFDSLIIRIAKENNSPNFICGIHTVLKYGVENSVYEKAHNRIYASSIYLKMLKAYSAFHCVNVTDYEYLKSRIKKRMIFLIPNFIEIPKSIGKNKTGFQVAFVGRLTHQKGIDYLIGLIQEVNNSPYRQRIKFVICGTGPMKNEIVALTKKFKNVRYEGHIKSNRMPEIYKKTDIILIPSIGETFSLTCLEAQSFGCIALGFTTPGLNEIVISGKTGFLATPGDIVKIQGLLTWLYELKNKERDEFLRMKEYSRASIEKRFSTASVVPKFEKMLQNIINS